jgi:uncharacterized protein (TIRG00374 family)
MTPLARRRVAIGLRLGGGILLVGLLYLFGRRVDWDVTWSALRGAALLPLALATACFFATLFGKAIAWKILLAPEHVVSAQRLFRYTIAAFAGSVLAPAKAGEVLRVFALRQRDGVPASDSTAVAVTDKLLHAVSLLMLAAPLPLLLPRLPPWVGDSLMISSSVAVGLFAALYFAVGKVEAREPQSWLGRVLAGMHAVREPKRLFAALGTIAVVWLLDLACIALVLRSVGVHIAFAEALFILFAVNLTIALPITPANVGTLQLGALLATQLLGIPREPALAFALLYHAIQIFPLLVVGFALEFRLVIPRGKLRT